MVCTRSKTGKGFDKGVVITRPLFIDPKVLSTYITQENNVSASEAIKFREQNGQHEVIKTIELFYHNHVSKNEIVKKEIYPSLDKPENVYTFHQLDSIGITIGDKTRYLKGVDSLIKAFALSDCSSKCDMIIINSKRFQRGAVTFAIDAIYKLIVFAQVSAQKNANVNANEFLQIYGNFVYRAADQVARVFKEQSANRSLLKDSTIPVEFITPSICGLNNFVGIVAAARMEYETKENELQMKIAAYSLSKQSTTASPASTIAAPASAAPASAAPASAAPAAPAPASPPSQSAAQPAESAASAPNAEGNACSINSKRLVTSCKRKANVAGLNTETANTLQAEINQENISRYISWARWQAGELLKESQNDQLKKLVYEYDVKSYLQRYYAGWLTECEKRQIGCYIKKAKELILKNSNKPSQYQGYLDQLAKLATPATTATTATPATTAASLQDPRPDQVKTSQVQLQLQVQLNQEHLVNHTILAAYELKGDYQFTNQLLNHISGRQIYSNVSKKLPEFQEFVNILNTAGADFFSSQNPDQALDRISECFLEDLAKQVMNYMDVDLPAGTGGGFARKIKVLGRLRTIFLKRGYQYVTVNGEPTLVSAAIKMEKKLAKEKKKSDSKKRT